MCSNAQTALLASSILQGYRDPKDRTIFKAGEHKYVVGDSYSVITTLVGWVLWWIRHHQPYSLIAGRSGRGSCDQSLQAPKPSLDGSPHKWG